VEFRIFDPLLGVLDVFISSAFAQTAPAAVSGKIVLENLAAGEWRVTWWDSLAGVPQASQTLTHAGGTLQLPTPPISRHAAVILERLR
jgi:hypothetical protein